MSAMRRKKSLLFAVSFVTAFTGCDTVAQYAGDGRLTDKGPSAATDRYVLDLEQVSLKAPTSATFKMKNLPKTEFVVGIELRSSASKLEQASINPTVGITLLEDGKAIVSKEAKLSEWTWSIHSPGNYAFVYGREQPSTYFTPTPGKNYELTFRVKEPDRGKANYTAALVAKSGGWK
ncbi:MAG: hypothetical protein ACREVR_16065 [Burkholderiales bacterium]